ncbi:MAG: YceI family protein [Chitinophagales bacterium]|nr:YceI family protein [Chitinophagales bacterium]
MKKLKLFLGAFTLIGFLMVSAQALKQVWTNDSAHSQLYFTVTHLGFNNISGTFDDVTINVTTTTPDFSDATIELSAKTNSINTLIEARDNHLKSADFFDAEKFPALTFKSTALKKKRKGKYKLTGNLTMHGVTKPVTLDLVFKGQKLNPMSSKPTTAFEATGIIKRSEFAVGDKFAEAIISDEVSIKFNGEFLQADKE